MVTLYLGVGAIVAGAPEIVAAQAQEMAKTALEAAEKLAEAGAKAIEGAITEATAGLNGPLTTPAQAQQAQDGAKAMMGSVAGFGQAMSALWSVVNSAIAGGQGNINLTPDLLAAVEVQPDLSGFSVGGLDPTAYWNSFVIQIETTVRPYQSGTTSGAANAYLEAVQLAAAYGQAVGDQQMQLLNLYTQGMAAFDSLVAVDQAAGQWAVLQRSLQTQEDQINAAIGLLEQGYTGVKRALVVAVTNYRAAFLYQWLQESDVDVNMGMSYLSLAAACMNSVSDLQKVLQGTPSGSTIKPPQTFTGVVYQVTSDPNPLFTEVNGAGQAQWSVGPDDLAGYLSGNTAIYLTEAAFVLEGATQSAEVELQVATSGHYVNQIGGNLFRFVSQPVSMTNDYQPGTVPQFITKWAFADATAYMKPSPYTQWTVTVQQGDWKDVTSIQMIMSGLVFQNPT
jgi:hypothetical protein